MKLAGALLATVLVCAGPILGQDTDPYSIKPLQAIINSRSLGVHSGWDERTLSRLGDRVGIGLAKIYGRRQLSEPQLLRVTLPLIREAFSDPQLISVEDDRDPTITFLLLDLITPQVEDSKLRDEIEQTKEFVLAQVRNYSKGKAEKSH